MGHTEENGRGQECPPGWTSAERRLWASFRRGDPLLLGTGVPEPRTRRRTLRASCLVQLLLAAAVRPVEHQRRPLEIRGASITGELDLSDAEITIPLVFRECRFETGIDLSDASTARVDIRTCALPRLLAPRLRCAGPLTLQDLSEAESVDLEDARIAGDVDLSESRLDGSGDVVNLCGARIAGDVMLNDCEITRDDATVNLMVTQIEDNLVAMDLRLDGTLFMPGAEIGRLLWLSGAEFGSLEASHCKIGLGVYADGISSTGNLVLRTARIGGDLWLDGARITAGDQTGIMLTRAEIQGSVQLRDRFTCRAEDGISFEHATIAGDVRLDDATIEAAHCALYFSWATISGGVTALEPPDITGLIALDGARIGGAMRLKTPRLTTGRPSPDDLCLSAFGASISTGLRFEDGATVVGDICLSNCVTGDVFLDDVRMRGRLSLIGTTVSGDVSLTGASVFTSGERQCLNLSGTTVSGDVFLDGVHAHGRLRLRNTEISGDLVAGGATLCVRTGRVLYLGDTVVRGNVFADKGLSTTGGEVRVAGLTVRGRLTLDDARLSHPGHVALSMSDLSVGEDVRFSRAVIEGGVRITASTVTQGMTMRESVLSGESTEDSDACGTTFSLDLTGTSIGRTLDLTGSELSRTLVLQQASVGQDVHLDAVTLADDDCALDATGLVASALRYLPAEAPRGHVRLTDARVDTLLDRPGIWPEAGRFDVDGFGYQRLDGGMTLQERLSWLRSATPRFTPGPYEQLATCLSAAGLEPAARTVRLTAIRRSYQDGITPDEGRAGQRGWVRARLRRLWGLLQDVVLGYGYRPMRAAGVFLVLWLGSSVALGLLSGPCVRPGAEGAGPCPVKADEHPVWDPFLYTLDLLVPVLDLGHEKAWDVVGPSKAVMWLLTVSGWVLATTIIAAAGRTLRRR